MDRLSFPAGAFRVHRDVATVRASQTAGDVKTQPDTARHPIDLHVLAKGLLDVRGRDATPMVKDRESRFRHFANSFGPI